MDQEEALDGAIHEIVDELLKTVGLTRLFEAIPDDFRYGENSTCSSVTEHPSKEEFVYNYYYFRIWDRYFELREA